VLQAHRDSCMMRLLITDFKNRGHEKEKKESPGTQFACRGSRLENRNDKDAKVLLVMCTTNR
jgi:hypothetical protein